MAIQGGRVVRDQAGFSLTELLVAMLLLLIVMGAILSLLETTTKIAPKDNERAHAVREAQVGLERMVRELRQAYRVLGATRNSIDVRVRLGTQDTRVLYQCDVPAPDTAGNPHDHAYRRCVRLAATNPNVNTNGTLPALSTGLVVIDRILNGTQSKPVFTYDPDALKPNYVTALIEVPSRGERSEGFNRSIVLDDGFFLRNTDAKGG